MVISSNIEAVNHIPEAMAPGVFGMTIMKNGEPIFLRMEQLTEENEKAWQTFARITSNIANDNRGVFSDLVAMLMRNPEQPYSKFEEHTNFTEEEHKNFTCKVMEWQDQSKNKIVQLLRANSIGSNHITTSCKGVYEEDKNYIVYASKNPNFSILNANPKETSSLPLKNYIKSYQDILICCGSTFYHKKNTKTFHNRGIFRNPHWVFENKYSGLSMHLHGLTAAVAEKFFPEKKYMEVIPVGSMQVLIVKSLQPGEGTIEKNGKTIDITDLKVDLEDPEGYRNKIKVEGLTRIFNRVLGTNS